MKLALDKRPPFSYNHLVYLAFRQVWVLDFAEFDPSDHQSFKYAITFSLRKR